MSEPTRLAGSLPYVLVAVPAAVGIEPLVQRGVARFRTAAPHLGETPGGS